LIVALATMLAGTLARGQDAPKSSAPAEAPPIPPPVAPKLGDPSSFHPSFDPSTNQAAFLTPEMTPEFHLEKARFIRKFGHWKNAIKEASQAIRIEPTNADALRLRADVYQSQGLYRHAIADLTRVIDRGDARIEDFENRGWYYCKDRDFGKGMADIEAALAMAKTDRDRARAHGFRAIALELRDEPEAALADFDLVQKLGPDTTYDQRRRGACFAKLGRHDLAIAEFDRVLATGPDPDAWFLRGQSRLARGKSAEALADFDQAIAANPGNIWYHQGRARALTALGQFDEAIAEFTAVLEALKPAPGQSKTFGQPPRGPSSKRAIAEALTGRGWAYLLKRDLDHAIADLDQAIEVRSPGMILITWGFAPSLAFESAYDRAITEFDERCRDAPHLPWALVILKGEDARSQFLKDPFFAAYLVCRTRPDPSIAPSLVFQVEADWRADPDVKSAFLARAIAAAFQSEWSDALDNLEGMLIALAEAKHPGLTLTRPRTLADFF
jgi:tetratricopeptide (TPR) repeat protein